MPASVFLVDLRKGQTARRDGSIQDQREAIQRHTHRYMEG